MPRIPVSDVAVVGGGSYFKDNGQDSSTVCALLRKPKVVLATC